MRLVFISNPFGGLDEYVRMMTDYLLSMNHVVHVIYTRKLPSYKIHSEKLFFHLINETPVYYYASRFGFGRTQIPARLKEFEWNLALSRKLRLIQKTQGLDLVELIEGTAYPELYNELPFVVKMHGSNWTFHHYCEDGSYNKWQIQNQRRMLLAARQIQALSHSLADFISGACDIPRRLTHVTPYPIDTSKFHPIAPPILQAPFHLMTVGRLEKRKGIHTLVQAMKLVWEKAPNTHLHLYGADGDFGKAQINEVVPEHQGRIHFEGFVSRETLIEAYQKSHVYVAPTRYETFGYTILEALACGRPVISSDIGPVPDLVRHEETGWLVQRDNVDELAQTILFALQHPEERETYGRAGRKHAERYSLDRIMPKQLELYEKAIKA